MIERELFQAKIKQFNEVKDIFNKNSFKNENIDKEWNEFFEQIKELAISLQNYGYKVKITTPIVNGFGESNPYTLILTPYYVDKNINLLLTGTWDNEYTKVKLYNSYNPNAPSYEIPMEDSDSHCFKALNFILLQILDKKEYILEEFERQAMRDLDNFIQFNDNLNHLLEKYA